MTSMGPRRVSRGNLDRIQPGGVAPNTLQWGRGVLAAEMRCLDDNSTGQSRNFNGAAAC